MSLSWIAESLRFTLFSNTPPRPDESLIRMFVGVAADERSEKPALGIRQERVGFHTGQLITAIQPGRVDLHFVPNPRLPHIMPSSALVEIGPYAQAYANMRPVIETATTELQDVTRVALAPVLLLPCDSLTEAYQFFASLWPGLNIEPDSTRDLLVGMNRPKTSVFNPAFTVNRIFKVEIAEIELVSLDQRGNSVATGLTSAFVRAELDLSTIDDGSQPLSVENIRGLVLEFCEDIAMFERSGDFR